jgi:hypothetical protein
MSLYLEYYVDWDINIDKYISYNKQQDRKNKIEYINDMYENDVPLLKGSLEEFNWLYEVEQDTKVKRIIKKIIDCHTP